MTTAKYRTQVASISAALSELLGVNLSSGHARRSPHFSRVIAALSNWRTVETASDWRKLHLLGYFGKHLEEIRLHRPEVLDIFRRDFRRARIESQYVGLRFEVYVAASLSRKRVSFKKIRSSRLYCSIKRM